MYYCIFSGPPFMRVKPVYAGACSLVCRWGSNTPTGGRPRVPDGSAVTAGVRRSATILWPPSSSCRCCSPLWRYCLWESTFCRRAPPTIWPRDTRCCRPCPPRRRRRRRLRPKRNATRPRKSKVSFTLNRHSQTEIRLNQTDVSKSIHVQGPSWVLARGLLPGA